MKRSKSTTTLIVGIAVFFVVYASVKVGRTGTSQPSEVTIKPSSPDLEVELISLRPSGCEPAEITRSRGAFVLFIDDRTGRESSTLSLVKTNGDRMKQARTTKKRSEWQDLIDLTPGVYLLVDAANPQTSCRITILP